MPFRFLVIDPSRLSRAILALLPVDADRGGRVKSSPHMAVSTWLIALEVVWVLGVTIWIALEKRPPHAALAWIVALCLLPAVGVPIYLLIGPRRLERQRRRYRLKVTGFARTDPRSLPAAAISPDVLRQIRLAIGAAHAPLLPASRIEVHETADPFFEALGRAIDGACHHIHVEFYIWEPDELGLELLDRLAGRAEAGVEVRLLIDAVGSAHLRDRHLAALRAAGGEVRRFNPPFLRFGQLRFLNFRTHRKIIVIDGDLGFTGGMNVSRRHAYGSGSEPSWRDAMAEVEGTAVAGLQALFLENWYYACGKSPQGESYLPRPAAPAREWLQVVGSGPDRNIYPIHELVVSAISSADQRVWIVNPYFVPDASLLVALVTAAHRGVDVRLIVPRRGDSRLVAAAMRSYFDELLEAGVKIYEYLPAMQHAKTLLVDDELGMIGSANLDTRSFRLNFEVSLALYGRKRIADLAQSFERDLAHSERVPDDRRRRLDLSARIGEGVARILGPIL
jgi:cardiolipin synthase